MWGYLAFSEDTSQDCSISDSHPHTVRCRNSLITESMDMIVCRSNTLNVVLEMNLRELKEPLHAVNGVSIVFLMFQLD